MLRLDGIDMEEPTLLIVDDDPLVRRSLGRWLRACLRQGGAFGDRARGEVWCCGSGRELDHRLEAVTAAVLDLELQGETGIDIADQLPPGVPFVFFTGCVEGPLLERARALGPVLRKDQLHELRAVVARWLRRADALGPMAESLAS